LVARDDVLRIFFAIEIGDAARRAAGAVAERLAAAPGGEAVRWVRPEAYHVTLRFLGTTPLDRVAGLVAAAQRATRNPPFELRLGALAGFPSRRPRAVGARMSHRGADRGSHVEVERGRQRLRARGAPSIPHPRSVACAGVRRVPRPAEGPPMRRFRRRLFSPSSQRYSMRQARSTPLEQFRSVETFSP
jgi:2'-5' RNA ligase